MATSVPYDAKETEKYLVCPYNSSHHILMGRMNAHLVKCQKSHPNIKLAQCLYNSTHRVPHSEINYHHETCKDRIALDKYVLVPEDVDLQKYPVQNSDVATEEELWDGESYPTYDPAQNALGKAVLRKCQVQPRSVRKNFRAQERQRHQQLAGELDKVDSESDNDNDSRKTEKLQMRRPAAPPAAASANATIVTEEDPEIVALLTKVKLGAASGAKKPNVITNTSNKGNKPQLESKTATKAANSQRCDDDIQNAGTSGYTEPKRHGPWTAAEIAKRASKPQGKGRGRLLANNK